MAEGNAGHGIHPGSGSQKPVVRHCRSIHNGGDGLFVCWRVKHGQFEGNALLDNDNAGISIGHKDTDNLFRDNRIEGNRKTGVNFRDETAPMGAHRNVFERNVILDNGGPAVSIRGHHEGLIFRQNTLGNSQPLGGKSIGISLSPGAEPIRSEDNHFENVSKPQPNSPRADCRRTRLVPGIRRSQYDSVPLRLLESPLRRIWRDRWLEISVFSSTFGHKKTP